MSRIPDEIIEQVRDAADLVEIVSESVTLKRTGAVRERVHAVLKGDRRVSRYALAPANQGGSGATIVEFRG